MNDTEQLIKEALGKLAERTPHPGPTLNALRRKRKNQRSVFMIAAAGMAAVVVLIFAGVVASDRYQPLHHDNAAAALVGEQGIGVSLRYSPHWLPEGFVENFRGTADKQVSRVWVPAGDKGYPFNDGRPTVVVGTSAELPPVSDKEWEPVTVRGLQAWVRLSQGQSEGLTAHVVWRAQDILNVSVRGVEDVRAAALRVADSVRADAKSTHQAPFKIELKAADNMWGAKPAEWTAMTFWKDGVSVQVSTAKPEVSGPSQPVTVRGKEGFRAGDTVAVFDGGLWIYAKAGAPTGTQIEAVNKVELVPSPDTSWIGKGL